MTFSQRVKMEIMQSVRNAKPCCAASFLAAVLKSAGSLALGRGGYSFSVESDNAEFLELCANLAKERLGVESAIEAYNLSAKKTAVYTCKFDSALGDKLHLTERVDGLLQFAPPQSLVPDKTCCKRAFLQGLFAASGSVMAPQSENPVDGSDNVRYHLEIRFADREFAQVVEQAYSQAEFRLATRKNCHILYLKESERIADFLAYVDATKCYLQLENVLVARNVRNVANRQSNCTVANIEKAVAAAARQLEAIRTLRERGLFEGLPENLKQIALCREQNPEATLDEIAALMHISKSGANHRFARLLLLAE